MIQLDDFALSLDRREKGSTIDFISHAHSDHIAAAKSSRRILASDVTKQLLQTINAIEPQQKIDAPKSLRLINAGHILGSKQIVINDEKAGRKTVYTGDFQLQKSRSCEMIDIEDADTVIIDSTYYQPDIIFDERNEVEPAIQHWADVKLHDGIVLFGTYALGKAQELVSILNESGILPIVSKKISRINKVYQGNGVKLDYASAYEGNDDFQTLLRGNFVGIVDNHLLNSMAVTLSELYNKKVYTAVATGFAKMMKFNTDVQFPLSDHADFKQCVDYINATGAKKVLTYGSNRLELANELVNKGYDVMPY
jgi:Cft2 family RNA processing exonuclease